MDNPRLYILPQCHTAKSKNQISDGQRGHADRSTDSWQSDLCFGSVHGCGDRCTEASSGVRGAGTKWGKWGTAWLGGCRGGESVHALNEIESESAGEGEFQMS